MGQPLTDKRLEALAARSPKERRPKAIKGKFLRGPIPLHWLAQAEHLSGKCLAVGVVLWFLRGLKDKSTFTLEKRWCEQFGLGRGAVRRCLTRLEEAGLISVERRPGCSPVVSIHEHSMTGKENRETWDWQLTAHLAKGNLWL